MPQAQARAQLPQAFPLTPAEINTFDVGGVHLVTLREEDGFVPHMEVKPLRNQERIPIGAVTVASTAPGVHLRYQFSTTMGAPNRSHRPPIEFDVARGRRARITYNGRFSGYSIEWLYKLTVITIAVDLPLSSNLFTIAPDHAIEDLAELF